MFKKKLIASSKESNSFPILIKDLFYSSLSYNAENEILYKGRLKYSYVNLKKRIQKLSSVLREAGVRKGDSVAILDWNSHRYLECLFAVPMMGANLHVVNLKLSPEEMVYSLNHAQDKVLLIHVDFITQIEKVASRLENVHEIIVLGDGKAVPENKLDIFGAYEVLLEGGEEDFIYPDFEERNLALSCFAHNIPGKLKAHQFSHQQIVSEVLKNVFSKSTDFSGSYLPLSPLYEPWVSSFPYIATLKGMKQVFPGKTDAEFCLELFLKEKIRFSH
ncbi:AMP-binding protein, partial [Xanthovirga aplysinae]|uniref:AMP-binding protein n=1 Tax=Xanthovirga aplysinae TaxID=2529853 RepID=UPI0012BC5DBD